MIVVLKDMPEYKKKKRLDLWEAAYNKTVSDEEEKEYSFNFKIIDMIYELAVFNLYSAFNKKDTHKYYRKIIKDFSKEGITISKNLDVSNW